MNLKRKVFILGFLALFFIVFNYFFEKEAFKLRNQLDFFSLSNQGTLNFNLWNAITNQKIDLVKSALKEGAQVNSYEKVNKTCQLTHAIAQNYIPNETASNIISLLKENGAVENCVDILK